MHDQRPTERQRELADQKAAGRRRRPAVLKAGETPLLRSLNKLHQEWLLRYCSEEWQRLHQGLDTWREKLRVYEEYADGDYSSRVRPPDPEKTDATRSMFEHQNYTLGLADGFCDYVKAQAKDDIFGLSPWISATPEGKADIELAENITRHAQWRLRHSNVREAMEDAISLAVDLGTAFIRERWEDVGESYEEIQVVAFNRRTGEDLVDQYGEKISTEEEIPDELRGPDIDWREELVAQPLEVYRNVHAECLDYRNVAFEPEAAELDLRKTDFFTRFTLGLHDLVAHYQLTEAQRLGLEEQMNWEIDEEAREHRDSEATSETRFHNTEPEANPPITLVEGFVRCDPRGDGRPIRIHIVFSPTLNVLFTADYLANRTPGGLLPVFPVRCFKRARRIIGFGYREAADDQNDAVDEQHNAAVVRNRQSAEVWKGANVNALEDQAEGEHLVNYPQKVWRFKEGFTMKDFMSFERMPDASDRTIEIMNQHMQMAQMRFGITSAAQGELKGVPQSNTAYGVSQVVSRGATLVKTQIDQIKEDLNAPAEYAVHLTYANQIKDETFTWGEGETAELIEIRAGDVKDLRMNVHLTLAQAQNTEKLESSRAAMEIVAQFATLDPPNQMLFRRIFVQALTQLGFPDAEDMVQAGPIDPEQLIELLDPSLQPVFLEALRRAQGGPEGSGEGNPSEESGGAVE